MTVVVYVEGSRTPEGSISLPLSSCTVLLITSYSHPSFFRIVFVDAGCRVSADNDQCISISSDALKNREHDFASASSVPKLVRNVSLPAVFDEQACLVRSGLCVVIRHIVRLADTEVPDQHLTDLLGFRQGSLRMCAEVSGWTKLCEVELPCVVSKLIQQVTVLQSDHNQSDIEIPNELFRLETHLGKPPKVHNDDRMRRQELAKLQAEVTNTSKGNALLKNITVTKTHLSFEKMTKLNHGWRKICVDKSLIDDKNCDISTANIEKCDGNTLSVKNLHLQENEETDRPDLMSLIQSLTYLDIRLVHLYSEGVEITIADLCLFTYLYYLLESLQFSVSGLRPLLPRVLQWLSHMTCLPNLEKAALHCGMNFAKLKGALEQEKQMTPGGDAALFRKPEVEVVTQDDLELSRRCQTKYKAIKPEVIEAMKKMEARGIVPEIGEHPRGTNVQLDWDSLPPSVHPREGEVPKKRLERKCQQLENLVTAVQEIAKPGDIIVDFCSGGGHLGIAIAYMLPQCQVYLVENKEESLIKARSRMDTLALTNVVLYQCNLDYFVGNFDVGVCLHACGSATDMVLHQCLSHDAAFVICPCCYGSIQQTHLLTYPRSHLYRDKGVTYTEFLTLGHAADQTEFNIALEQQGRVCMNLVDSDRAQLARESGYSVTLCSLYPLTCSPKNNLLIGQKRCS